MTNTQLFFGPYRAPKIRRGQIVVCEFRKEVVRVGKLSDAPIRWPRVKQGGPPSLIVCGDLVRAIQVESVVAIRHHWGVGGQTVWRWKKAFSLGRMTEGTKALYRELLADRIHSAEAKKKSRLASHAPEIMARSSAARRGKPVSPQTQKAAARAARRKWSKVRKRAMATTIRATIRAGRLMPPVRGRPWTEKEIRLLGMTLDSVVAQMTGRTVCAVRGKRRELGIAASRHARLRQMKKS